MKKYVSLFLIVALLLSSVAFAEETVLTFTSRGVEVPATIVTPDRVDSYPVVVMSHGHGGSRDENVGFPLIAEALKNKGIATIRMDFSGCGESTESFQQNNLTNMKADVQSAIQYMQNNYPITQVGLFGYSMGGRITLELLAEGIENISAITLLAPAASAGKNHVFFGTPEKWVTSKEEAEKNGFMVNTTIYGQVQELSYQWFTDLEKYEDVIPAAASAYHGPALVIYADEDEAVPADVSKQVAAALNAKTVVACGAGHGYGFYSEEDTVRTVVANATADFFADTLTK